MTIKSAKPPSELLPSFFVLDAFARIELPESLVNLLAEVQLRQQFPRTASRK
jgi:hypothetical protein